MIVPQNGQLDIKTQQRVLFLTDDPTETELYSFGLRQKRVQTVTTHVDEFVADPDLACLYDLIVFDIMALQATIPDQLGAIASQFAGPLLFLTYEQDERFQLQTYKAGVDECITKPIGISLLFAKISTWLRHAAQVKSDAHDKSATTRFALDDTQRLLQTPTGEAIKLSNLEYRLLRLFLSNPGQILESALLIKRVWTEYDNGDPILLKNLVYRVRRKIENDPGDPRRILTVPGQGYMFDG